MVECLAGEANVPVVKLKNFRDMWVGSTEGNLEKIFRLVHALGKCMVFVDEADQALGRRQAASGDSGTSGRVYGMIAEEMGSSRNRGRIMWVLASSRPDLIEVDLKRPGRVDVKIPILPTSCAEEGFALIRALCGKRKVGIDPAALDGLRARIPDRLTPGAAEALAVKVYRLVRTENRAPLDALHAALDDYRPAVPPDVMEMQIQLAVSEASDASFIPPAFRR
jgi:SpoVK/Ycf46/Vps4 family AAA+-type ATPase